MIAQCKPRVGVIAAYVAAHLHPPTADTYTIWSEALYSGAAIGARGCNDHSIFVGVFRDSVRYQLYVRQGDPASGKCIVYIPDGAVYIYIMTYFRHALQEALSFTHAISNQHGSMAFLVVLDDPVLDVLEDLVLSFPFVDRET